MQVELKTRRLLHTIPVQHYHSTGTGRARGKDDASAFESERRENVLQVRFSVLFDYGMICVSHDV